MPQADQRPIQVLLVEDNPGDARLVRLFLLNAQGGIGPVRLAHAATLAEALAQLQAARFDVVLLDLSLPDSTGMGTVEHVQQAAPETAVVVFTGFDDPDFALSAVHSGAQDYLVKGQGDGFLVYRSLRYAIERKRLERELVEARKVAEEANFRKSRFLASMSHELRTPLNAILGFSEVIKEQMMGPVGVPKYAEYANDIFNAGTHLLGLINDVLDLSKVEAGRFQLLEEDADMPALVRDCLDMIAENAVARGVGLSVALPPSLLLRCDARLVKQILLNLLSNALKFTPSGGKVQVSLADDGAEGVALTVTDSGVGIAADAVDKVMEEFQQADITIARDHGGTGLGLPLSRRFMGLHGGSLTLVSTEGQGTAVTARFPAARLVKLVAMAAD
jgi:signal transduction histidine kinase